MLEQSIWRATSRPTPFPRLEGEITVDVAIVGGGVTGITTAMLLAKAGKSVAVLEAHEIGGGTTGHSTGNLYATVGAGLAEIESKWNEESMARVARSRGLAIDLIEANVREFQIDCAFGRRPMHLYAPGPDDDAREKLEKEADACRRAGLATQLVDTIKLPCRTGPALVIENQAQFHPLEYVRAIARRLAGDGCRIFENSEVLEIDEEKREIRTAQGRVVAAEIVMATHTPKGFDLVQTELGPYREYAIAGSLKSGMYPQGIFWSEEAPRHSTRSLHYDGSDYLMVIGRKHKTGQEADPGGCYRELEAFMRANFDVDSIDFRWSAQGYYPADGLPYIGRSSSQGPAFIATGFAADGLVYGTLAARIIADEILGRENEFAELYKATRISPAKAAKKFVKENLNVVAEYVKDYAAILKPAHFEDVARGEGRIIEVDGKRCAVYRDEAGVATAVSPICTHLKCVVHWNGAEKSWDCPCHGSRFATDGTVLEGPAPAPLARIEVTSGEPYPPQARPAPGEARDRSPPLM